MDKALVDVPVALIFFNRAEPLKKTFEAIRNAKPTKLFLIQDGARDGRADDEKNILACREVVENVDWECDVKKIYSDVNLGCGKRIYSGLTEAFESVDRLVIIEDDIVASKSFFTFAAQMLEKYKDDERIKDITGMNHCGINKRCPYDYFFSKVSSCWGWATWKRVWDKMEYNFDFMEDSYAMDCFKSNWFMSKSNIDNVIKDNLQRKAKLESGGKLTAWTRQFMMEGYMQSRISIIPTKNLTSNIGLTGDSTHASDSIKKIPKRLQCVFFAKTYELEFPLKHPKYIIDDRKYSDEVRKILGTGKLVNYSRRIEGAIRRRLFK